MDESSDALDSMVYSMELIKQIEGETMGLNSMMGQGIIGNAQNSLMGGTIGSSHTSNGAIANSPSSLQAQWNAAQNAASLGPQVIKSSYPYKPDKARLEMHLKITQAENGFIVSMANHYGDVLEPHIAVTIEDVTTIITSQLASRMLDRVANE